MRVTQIARQQQIGQFIVVMSTKNASNVSSVVVLNSLLIVVMSAQNVANVSSLAVLNSLLILVMSTANALNVNNVLNVINVTSV